MNQSTKSLAYEILFERSRSRLDKQNSIALPPIASSDGVPTVVNTFLKKNYERLREERSGKCRKRAKTHTLYKDIDRGDAWELLKAEKIRNNELQKYQAKLKREKLLVQQQMMKRHNVGQRVVHRNVSTYHNKVVFSSHRHFERLEWIGKFVTCLKCKPTLDSGSFLMENLLEIL